MLILEIICCENLHVVLTALVEDMRLIKCSRNFFTKKGKRSQEGGELRTEEVVNTRSAAWITGFWISGCN